MKHVLMAVCVAVLTGCVSVPVAQNFPRASDTLMTPPPALKEIPPGSTASGVFDTVIENYGTYNQVATQLRGWQQWYQEQQKIYESIGK
jgi:hypothetical protein